MIDDGAQHRKQRLGQAKMRVAKWFDTVDQNSKLRSKLLRGVESMAAELPARNDWLEVMTVSLGNGYGPPIRINTDQMRVAPVDDGLAVSTIVPGWGFGWRSIFKDEEVYEILSWFLHYARQYVHRSRVASVLMIAWEDHARLLHPFGARVMTQRYTPEIAQELSLKSEGSMLDVASKAVLDQWSSSDDVTKIPSCNSEWIHRNTLDPTIHQSIFHYLRAQDLRSNGFDIEAVVAFDCVLQSISRLLTSRLGLEEQPTRRRICEILELSEDFGRLAEYMYFLRNDFGAHSGGWRWWDVGELLGEHDLDVVAQLSLDALTATATLEAEGRIVDPAPADWAEWFLEHFELLWDTVWFERLDSWHDKQT